MLGMVQCVTAIIWRFIGIFLRN